MDGKPIQVPKDIKLEQKKKKKNDVKSIKQFGQERAAAEQQ